MKQRSETIKRNVKSIEDFKTSLMTLTVGLNLACVVQIVKEDNNTNYQIDT